MSTNQNAENGAQSNNNNNNDNNNNNNNNNMCRCGQGDPNMWTNRPSDNSADKQSDICPNCQIIKSGHLLVSSKGIGWTSWKRRYFVLTRTSLIFFRHDPNVPLPPVRGTEPNATLGGMDLNNSGSLDVKADRKLITVAFPDGRTFTFKTETTEDLNEWKSALEQALMHAPSASNSLGQNGILRTDSDQLDIPLEQQLNEKPAEKSTIIHTPVEFALEDENGNPSFLEKALCFIEDYGIKVEGILRQSADVEEVKRRVQDYEQGKDEFLPNEDAHVIGDCIKLVLREMPGYPVPAACCTTLVQVFRTERTGRIEAMTDTIYETFPEPNRRLLQRILSMMLVVESHKTENRMSLQALSACMAPLLLRPLLVGDLEGDFNQSAAGDNSVQLLQAAAAANHAQAIITILLEEFDQIFDDDEDEDEYSSEGYTEDDAESHEEEEGSSDNETHEDDEEQDDDDDVSHEEQHEVDVDDDVIVHSSSSDGEIKSKAMENVSKNNIQTNDIVIHPKAELMEQKEMSVVPTFTSSSTSIPPPQSDKIAHNRGISLGGNQKVEQVMENQTGKLSSSSMIHPSLSRAFKLSDRSDSSAPSVTMMAPTAKRPIFGRTSARKNLSLESVETNNSDDDEHVIQKLESSKVELQTKLATEKKENEVLQANLEKKKETLHEHRLELEKELNKLHEQLKQEKRLRSLLESGLTKAQSSGPSLEIDSKVLADLEYVAVQEEELSNLKQKVLDLRGQYNNQLEESYASLRDFCNEKLNKDHTSK